ncbi:MAG: TetR/AcrR family transcriptional regulator [Chloroflexota bacterium]|nr:TetR/AcrR family transcriptional regulator [Chloroflexia bacterium]MDQ3227203.1 TetR/AcrR family transcriptional regulator [Chloroflexota bacterium]
MDALPSADASEPATIRGREAKARIIATAAELMYERGVAATSVDDIVAAAGAGKSQFYHYFSSKTDLVAAVLRHQLARVLDDQSRFDIATWDGIQGWLTSLVMQQAARGFSGGCPLGSIVAEVVNRDERLQTVAAEAFSLWEKELATGLRALQETGRLHADADPAALAEEALASIQGGYLLTMSKREARPMRNAITAAFARLRSFAI